MAARGAARSRPVDRPGRAAGGARRARVGRGIADGRRSRRPSGPLSRVRAARVDLCLAHHALERGAAVRLRGLPPPRPHLRHGQSELPERQRLPQRGGELPGGAGGAPLRRRDAAPLAAPPPRRVEHAAHARARASALRAHGTAVRSGVRDGRRGGQRVLPACRAVRVRQVTPMELRANVPSGPIERKWEKHRSEVHLVSPTNKRKYHVVVVGSGLAGASAAASLAELGYRVTCFCYQDSPRRAHSIAAQGGINAAKNYRNDGDSVFRLFYDTVKGGDFRSREANVHRLAEVSVQIIDQCVAQGVPFAREYGGLLDNRSFGGVQVSRTFYARGQTGQQLLLGAYQALQRQIGLGQIAMHSRHEMLDLVVIDGRARGVVVRDMVTGAVARHSADAVVLATGGYGNVFFLATYAKGCNATAIWRAYRRGAGFANPCFTQIHPTCIPVSGEYQSKLTLMSESLRNDGRIWVPQKAGDRRPQGEIPEAERDYYLERAYPSFGNLAPRDIASRAAKRVCDEGRGVGPGGYGVYVAFAAAIAALGRAD